MSRVRVGLTMTPMALAVAWPVHSLRMTIPVSEALVTAGNRVDEIPHPAYRLCIVTMCGTVPTGLVPVLIGGGNEQHRALRMAYEPRYPGEWPGDAIAWWERGEGCLVPFAAPRSSGTRLVTFRATASAIPSRSTLVPCSSG